MALLLRAQAGSRVVGIYIMQNAIQRILASRPSRLLELFVSGMGCSNQNIANILAFTDKTRACLDVKFFLAK
jgi:hypothetical protein